MDSSYYRCLWFVIEGIVDESHCILEASSEPLFLLQMQRESLFIPENIPIQLNEVTTVECTEPEIAIHADHRHPLHRVVLDIVEMIFCVVCDRKLKGIIYRCLECADVGECYEIHPRCLIPADNLPLYSYPNDNNNAHEHQLRRCNLEDYECNICGDNIDNMMYHCDEEGCEFDAHPDCLMGIDNYFAAYGLGPLLLEENKEIESIYASESDHDGEEGGNNDDEDEEEEEEEEEEGKGLRVFFLFCIGFKKYSKFCLRCRNAFWR